MTPDDLLPFLAASVALSLAPGPDNLFVLTLGISRGARQATAAAWGMASGITVHTLAAALGISAVFYSSALAFQAVKYAGAGYLLYLAWRAVRAPAPAAGSVCAASESLPALYRRGFLMNVLNPKVALFFLAFLPQFVTRGSGHVPVQMLILGWLFMAQAGTIFTLIALSAGAVGRHLLRRPRAALALNWLAAGVFVTLAVRLALARR